MIGTRCEEQVWKISRGNDLSGGHIAFGQLQCWRAMMRLEAWIEPVLVGKRTRLIRVYAERTGIID